MPEIHLLQGLNITRRWISILNDSLSDVNNYEINSYEHIEFWLHTRWCTGSICFLDGGNSPTAMLLNNFKFRLL